VLEAFGLRRGKYADTYNDGVLSNDEKFGQWYGKPKGYFVFTIVRNPWDRFISGYKYFPDLRDKPIERVIDMLHKFKGRKFNHLSRLQTSLLIDKENNYVPDFTIRFENIEEDWNKLCKILNINYKLPHLNKSRHKHYTEYYNVSTKEKVRKYFKKDIDFWGYTYD
jgi:hypothetical protein